MVRPRSLARVSGATNTFADNAVIVVVVAAVIILPLYLYYWVGKTVLKGQKF